MSKDIDVTQNELLEALRKALERDGPDDAYTTTELSRALGWGVRKVRNALRPLIREGTVEPVRVQREALDDRTATVSAYRLTDG